MSFTDDYQDSGRYSKADMQRRLAQLLAAQGSSTEPIASGWQGAAKLAQALAGVLGNRAANKREAAQQEALVQAIYAGTGMLGGGGGAPDIGPATTGSISGGGGGGGGGIGSDVASSGRLPAGMRNNNPGNIKYTSNSAFPGVVGPSQNTDQGDPQAVFATPEAGMAAAASLLRRKFNGGKVTADQIIAGNMGWTPGNHAAAANIARTMGVGPHDQLNLNDPSQMQRFMRGLLLQEHGPKSQMYDDAMIGRAVGMQAAGETAALPGVQPVSDAPAPDVAQFLGMLDAQRAQGAPATPGAAMQSLPNVTPQMIDALRRAPQRPRGQYPSGMQPRDFMQPLGGQPMSAAPSPDVMAFIGGDRRTPVPLPTAQPGTATPIPPAQPLPSTDVPAQLRQVSAQPRVVYPPQQPPPQPVPNVGMGQLTGSGTRPPIQGGPAEMMTPAPIGRGAVAQPVPGMPMPTRPTVTGYPNVPGALGPALPSNDPMVQPSAVSPPDALGRPGTPATDARLAVQQPVTGHYPMQTLPVPPPAPIGKGMSIGPYGGQIASAVAAPPAQAAVPPLQQDPRARAIQAVVQAQGRTDVPPVAPPAPLIGRTPAPIQPPAAPVARTPVPRPAPAVASPVVPSAAGPATTAAVPQQRGQIFREPYPSVLSAQEFARQGQNYLTGRPSFANQQRVAPRTMQGGPPAGASVYGRAPGTSPGAPAPVYAGGPGAGAAPAGPASPRQSLIQRLFGGGGGGGAAAAQGAPAGSPVAGDIDPRRMALARMLANANMPTALKTALLKQAYPKAAGNQEYGLTPVYGKDAQGNTILLQLSKEGGVQQVQTPAGVTISTGVDTIDIGTGYLLKDKKDGHIIGTVPKDVAGEAAAKETGTATGKAAGNLDSAINAGNRMLGSIDSVLNDPALSQATGPIQSQLPTVRGDTARAESKIKQIQGGTFLQAYNDLRGGGQITEKEGEAALQAYNRLQSTNMGDTDYVEALKEFRTEVQTLMGIARKKAGQPAAPTDAETPMPSGTGGSAGKPLVYNPETGEFE